MKHKPIPKLTKKDLVRFWAKVHKQKKCWKWIASTKAKGYGQFHIKSSMYLATRISYAIANSDPGELCVCHSCDNPACVNPAHLWIGTDQANMDDCAMKNRQIKGENNSQAKLTDKQVKKILESDEIHQVLADRYGVSRSNISSIKRGKAWKHIEGKRHIGDARANSQTGVKGVSPQGNKYVAQTQIKGKCHYLGTFNTIIEAEQALNKWKENHNE